MKYGHGNMKKVLFCIATIFLVCCDIYTQEYLLTEIEDIAISSTMDAHFIDGGHNNILIELDCMDEFNLGQLMFFFCKACAMSAYLLGVNPFNQPGVEIYKARMKSLLNK